MKYKNKKRNIRKGNRFYILKLSTLLILVFFLCPKSAYFSAITEQNIVNLTNIERNNNNLGSLRVNNKLIEAANKKAEDILKYQSFEHNVNGDKFSKWVQDTDYNYYYVGENLAIDFMSSENTVKAWMKSESHRSNILNENFLEIGVAVVEGVFNNRSTIIVVQIFGSPLSYIANDSNITPAIGSTNILDSNIKDKTTTINKYSLLLFSSLLLLLIFRIAHILENYYHNNNLHHKIKTKMNF